MGHRPTKHTLVPIRLTISPGKFEALTKTSLNSGRPKDPGIEERDH